MDQKENYPVFIIQWKYKMWNIFFTKWVMYASLQMKFQIVILAVLGLACGE